MIKYSVTITLLISAWNFSLYSQDSIYLFSFFKDNGEDGLHYAYSEDGNSWKALNKNQSFLTYLCWVQRSQLHKEKVLFQF